MGDRRAYEAYMGRWSRPLARVFVEWLHPKPSAHWLEVGCGTGALTSTICDLCRCFWEEAVASDPRAGAFNESRRFPLCQRSALESLFRAAGLAQVETDLLDIPTDFASFDDYWTPFLRGTGPAPRYVVSLDPPSRELLRERLRRRLHPGSDGRIHLRARAWAVRGLSN